MTEPTAAELVARAEKLQPLVREYATQTENDRRVAPERIGRMSRAAQSFSQ
jgi:hypothetical protein